MFELKTTFALVANYQYKENYGAHNWNGEGDCPQHWKPKGGYQDVVLEGISVQEVFEKDSYEWQKIVAENGEYGIHYRSNYVEYELINCTLVRLDESLVQEVRKHLEANLGEDFGYARYTYYNDFAFDWAVDILLDREQLRLGGNPLSYQSFKFM